MSPVAQPDGHDGPGLLDEGVPGKAAVIDFAGQQARRSRVIESAAPSRAPSASRPRRSAPRPPNRGKITSARGVDLGPLRRPAGVGALPPSLPRPCVARRAVCGSASTLGADRRATPLIRHILPAGIARRCTDMCAQRTAAALTCNVFGFIPAFARSDSHSVRVIPVAGRESSPRWPHHWMNWRHVVP